MEVEEITTESTVLAVVHKKKSKATKWGMNMREVSYQWQIHIIYIYILKNKTKQNKKQTKNKQKNKQKKQ